MKTFEELKEERDELLRKKEEVLHAPDPFNTNNKAIYANRYAKKADEILKQMCVMKGIISDEIM